MSTQLEPIVNLPAAVDHNGEIIRLGDPVWLEKLGGGVVIGMYRPDTWGRMLVVETAYGEISVSSEAVKRNPAEHLAMYG